MSGLAEKDAFPTPEMKDSKGEVYVWPGPGLSVLEYTTIQFAAALTQKLGGVVEEDGIADMAYKQAKAVIKRLERGDVESELESYPEEGS